MKTKPTLIALFTMLAASAAMAANTPSAQIEVNFFEPQNYADAKSDSFDTDRGRDYVLAQLKEHILQTAPRYLSPGQQLVINVTDVDLAGEYEPWRGVNLGDVRMVREVYPPRLTLQFRLLDAEGNVVNSGKRELQDLGYLLTLHLPSSDPLRHDKGMISDWIRREFRRTS